MSEINNPTHTARRAQFPPAAPPPPHRPDHLQAPPPPGPCLLRAFALTVGYRGFHCVAGFAMLVTTVCVAPLILFNPIAWKILVVVLGVILLMCLIKMIINLPSSPKNTDHLGLYIASTVHALLIGLSAGLILRVEAATLSRHAHAITTGAALPDKWIYRLYNFDYDTREFRQYRRQAR